MRDLVPAPGPDGCPAVGPGDAYSRLVDTWLGGFAASTRLAYVSDLESFGAYVSDVSAPAGLSAWLAAPSGEAHLVATAYRDALTRRGLASATVARRLAALKSLSRLACKIGACAWILDVPPPKPEPRRDSRGPGRDEFARLWKAARKAGDSKRARRDRAIIALLYGHALRRAEVIGLDLADVDFAGGSVSVLGKGRREKQRITLDATVARHLESWAVARGSDAGPFFRRLDRPGGGDARLSGESVRLILLRLSGAAGLERMVRPHGLRHAAITEALALGETVTRVRRFSRHTKVETVMTYADALTDEAAEVSRAVAKKLK